MKTKFVVCAIAAIVPLVVSSVAFAQKKAFEKPLAVVVEEGTPQNTLDACSNPASSTADVAVALVKDAPATQNDFNLNLAAPSANEILLRRSTVGCVQATSEIFPEWEVVCYSRCTR